MLDLPWLRLLEAVRPEQVSLRVMFHELPRREGKCLAELFIEHIEGAVCEPGKLLDPKLNLSPRQITCVQIFIGSTAFSAKRDVYALSPAQAMSVFLLSNDVGVEVRNRGVVTLSPTPAFLKAFLEDEKIVFQAVNSEQVLIEEPTVLGVERAFLLDAKLRVYNLEPVFLPSEADALLSVPALSVDSFAHAESRQACSQLAKLGVDLSCLKELGRPAQSQIVLRALLGKSLELRLHLVNVLSLDNVEDEVEIRSKGALEPIFWLPNGAVVQRPTHQEEEARQALFRLGALPSQRHKGFSAKGQEALDLLSKISDSKNLPDWLHVDEDCLPQIMALPQKPILLVEKTGSADLRVQVKLGDVTFSLEKLFEIAHQDGQALLVGDDTVLTFSKEAVRSLKILTESLNIAELSESKEYSFFEIALLLRMLESDIEVQAEEALYDRLMKFVPKMLPEDELLPGSLQTTLRPYQHDAVAWMSQLDRAGLGRLLADEMGLGKTLMVLCLLAKIKERDGSKPNLVVAPTSVLDVWVAESKQHFEGLNTVKWHGADRAEQIEEAKKADLVITSYALLRRDLQTLSEINFRYLVVDEAQIIKNSKTESWKAARLIKSEQRLALSGTPIENRISDLHSILELVSPGILGDERAFVKRYGTGEKNAELRERVRPMILRRRKEEVESDLPPKIENILRCDMADQQRTLYLEILRAAQKELNQAAHNSIPLLAALTRLRQVCCDPSLLPDQNKALGSAKLDLFMEVIQDCLSNGRRIIVYSQFVKMQNILIEALAKAGIKDTLWLHGATQNRGEVVAEFQKPDGPKVIVVSLKAGGTGITLTAADTIIYYDPWWNPAVMDQAADRAHRIGQTKTVHLIKLVCQNSIEEQILALCEKKRAVADDVLLADQAGQRSLTLDDIRQLLQVEIDRDL
ncbi:MAG: DEAD/DEAH box helicase [Myxococcaceae bacterium]